MTYARNKIPVDSSHQEAKLDECTKLFFRVCGSSSEQILSVRMIQLQQENYLGGAAGSSPAQASAAAALQQIIFGMWLDKICRSRLSDKFKHFLSARRAKLLELPHAV